MPNFSIANSSERYEGEPVEWYIMVEDGIDVQSRILHSIICRTNTEKDARMIIEALECKAAESEYIELPKTQGTTEEQINKLCEALEHWCAFCRQHHMDVQCNKICCTFSAFKAAGRSE